MKTYKYLYKAILILLLLSSYLTHSQIRPSEFFKRQWLDLDSDASLCCNSLDETLDDFSFDWDYNYNTAFNNLVLLEQAKLDEIESWYRRQYNLIQDEIEKQLDTPFNSYDQAKKAFFSDIEGKNITRNTPILLSKYKKLYNPGRNKNRKYLKELKHLQLREIEIRAGNRNNSQFPYLQAKGVSLKGVTSLSKLSELKYDLENAFGNQKSRNHEYVYIIEKLDYLGSDFDKEMLNLKNKFYKSFDKWDQLGLMQYLLNYEYYKDFLMTPLQIPVELVEFQFSDMATEPVIEEYAKNNRGGGVSLFDPRYPEINRYMYQNNFCGGYIDLMAWEADKQAALDGYIDDVPTHRIIASNLIQELNITNQNQIEWLNSYTYKNDLNNLSNFMQNYRVNGIVPAEVINFAKEVVEAILNGAEVDYEERIINGLTGKDKCIYDKLKKLSLFKSTIKTFENNDNYNLTIINGNCTNTSTACTDGGDINHGNVKIIMEIVSGNFPLEYAATLLHEGIHAEIFKYVDEHEKGVDPNRRENLLYHYFEQKKIQKPNLVNTAAQHQHMADKYVKPIAEAIRKLDNNQYPLEYYMGFGWDGLRSYGFDGYFNNGNWVNLNKDQSTEYYRKQKIVNDNTNLKGNECR